MSNDLNSFSGYRQTVFTLREDLQKLRDYSEDLGLKMLRDSIEQLLKKSIEDSFNVAVIGEFRRGKSTLINALLGKSILPSDVLPTTATLNRVTYDIEQYVDIEYKDGTSEKRVPLENLEDYVTKITQESQERALKIKEAVVHYPTTFCKNNVDIIDTPGLNDDNCMTEITLSVIPNVDAAIFVIMGPSPFGMYEKEFLEKKMLASDIGRVIFVVTRMDEYTPEQAQRLLNNIKEERIKSILVKAKSVYGENSQAYKEYESKISDIKMIGISAKQALVAKETGDIQLLEKSNFLKFEETLEKLLTEDRGALTLNTQASKIISACTDILKSIELRTNALDLDSDDFNEKYDEALKKVENLRNQREVEFRKIRLAEKETEAEVAALINSFSEELKSNALFVIDEEYINPEDIKTKEGQQEVQEYIMSKIKESNDDYSQVLAERIQHTIEKCSGKEIERLSEYENKFYDGMNDIQMMFKPTGNSAKGIALGASGALISSTLLGGTGAVGGAITGAIVGYKQGGITGALVGGGVAAVGTMATSILLAAPLVAAGITLGPLLIVPILALSGAAGIFGSKFVVNKLFKRDNTAEFKEALKKAVSESYDNSFNKEALENQVFTVVKNTFDAIESKVNNETETILVDTENTLENLKLELAEKRFDTQRQQDELSKMIESVSDINQRACEINKYVISVLTKEEK